MSSRRAAILVERNNAPVSNKMLALVAAALPANIIREYLLLALGLPFATAHASNLLVSIPASAETRSAAEGRYSTQKRSRLRTILQEPFSCC
jgi:hypothetical protein